MKTLKTLMIACLLSIIMVFPVYGETINHNHTLLQEIPIEYIQSAQDTLRISYGHTSHGSQPIDGMETIVAQWPGQYDFTLDGSVVPGHLSIMDRMPTFDIGWGEFGTGWGSFDVRTRHYLNDEGADRNLVIWSWCGDVSDATEEYINTYLSLMEGLEADYPDVVFVYMTGHLDGTGVEGNLHQRNEQIRDYCEANDKLLYDFADIESYDPDGNYFLDLYATDACDYTGGNWATEWCTENPGDPLCYPCDICAHSESLNCNLKARAFWWMFARLVGWEPEAPTPPDTVECEIECTPPQGVLPLTVNFSVSVSNITDQYRVAHCRVDFQAADGSYYGNWRNGYTTLEPDEVYSVGWNQQLPALQTLVGDNVFCTKATDITPPPYNQPPYYMAGDTDSGECIVTGLATE